MLVTFVMRLALFRFAHEPSGLFADKRANPAGVDGAFYGDDLLIGRHIATLVCVAIACIVGSFLIVKVGLEQPETGVSLVNH
jgi:hypothetical protein